jgi:dTDP-4-dehydrorhamnose 3,5-epimerase
MKFLPTPIRGAFRIEPEKRTDERGFFARLFCREEFHAQGLAESFVQANVSRSVEAGTLRGMHYQLGLSAEVKLVRCTRGELFDVAIDLRPDSPTFGKWHGMDLNAESHAIYYIPRGCAHGFVTLTENAEIFYLVSAPYNPKDERAVRFNDPRFGIEWPVPVVAISRKDVEAPNFDPNYHGIDRLRGLL